MFRALGVPVYDSDSRAKELMLTDTLRQGIISLFGDRAYAGDRLDTTYIAGKVFTDKELLVKLNGVVHPSVMQDFTKWADAHRRAGYKYVVQENAILFDHGFDAAMDYTVTISAPVRERILRAARRDGRESSDIESRMANQLTDSQRESRADFTVRNGERDLIVPQIEKLHGLFMGEIVNG